MAKRTVSSTHQDFTSGYLGVIRADILSALKPVAERHGVAASKGD